MLVGSLACEYFGFHRVPTIHYFPGSTRASTYRGIALAHRYVAAPDSYQVSFLFSEKTQRTSIPGRLSNWRNDVNRMASGSGVSLENDGSE